MKITIQPTNDLTVPFQANIEITTLTVDAGSTFRVPVHKTLVNGKTFYDLEMCGFRAETERLEDIAWVAERLLSGLVNRARLPSYVFIARRAGGIYPVYTVDQEVFATTPGGPLFRHVELAKVREYLNDYLHETGVLGDKGPSDKLHVRGVDTTTLGLRRPIFYLKKRVPGETEFWAPVFTTNDGLAIYTYAASARREVPVDKGQEILRLRELVAKALQADKRLTDLYDLRADRLFPENWGQLETQLDPEGFREANGLTVALYRHAVGWLGLIERPEENRYSLYLGKDADDVCGRVSRDFTRRGIQKEALTLPELLPL
ncbi:MAG: hypothetical protein IPL78_04020 [Chloroflexi bacterium]|nr:hypothetical protein [Chloroflexota bacterium]